MKRPIAFTCLLVLCVVAIPAVAQNDTYGNGPTDGETNSLTIAFGYVVSDTFTLSSNATVNGLQFAAWLLPGDVLQSIEVSITSSEFGGTSYFDQTVNIAQGGCLLNGIGFNVCNETGHFTGVDLNAGTYWLNLQNGMVNTGDPVLWDMNSGPSLASQSSIGTIPSESFTILGSSGSSTGTTPEPSSLMLFASGALGVFGFVRRKFSA